MKKLIIAVLLAAPAPVVAQAETAAVAPIVSSQDYPASALRAGEEGVVAFRLTVGPDGRAHNCAVTSSSGSAALDNATCRIMLSRARFRAARDVDGRPTTGSFESRLTWRINDPPTSGPPDISRAE